MGDEASFDAGKDEALAHGESSPPSADQGGFTRPPADPLPRENELGEEMTLVSHLEELRNRFVHALIASAVGFLACLYWAKDIFAFLMKPLTKVLPEGSRLIYTGLPEGFFTYMKVAFVAGVGVASPYIFYQIWMFVAPGLYKTERRLLVPIGVATGLCFVAGAVFGYTIVFPAAFEFFVSFTDETIQAMPKMSEALSLALSMLLAFGIIFELPVFMFFLGRLGLVTTKGLAKFRRWNIFLAFVAGAILTPTPDALNQCLMAIPIIVLYEVGVLLVWLTGKKKEPAPADAAPPAETEGSQQAAAAKDQAEPAAAPTDKGPSA